MSRGAPAKQVYLRGIDPGDYHIALRAIVFAQWSKKQAQGGETVRMLVETAGIEDGAKATFEVWKRDFNRADRQVARIVDCQVDGNAVEAEWKHEYDKAEIAGHLSGSRKDYSSPQFFFRVSIGDLNVSSDLLDYQDTIEIELINDRGKCIPNEEYRLRLSNGEIRHGKLDSKGHAKEARVPAAGHRLEFPHLDQAFRTNWNQDQATTNQRGPAIRILPEFTRITHTKLIVFMDVGVWFEYDRPRGLAHTDFGLVSGNHVLRCSWLNMEHHPRNPWIMSQFSPAVREFFKKCPRDRGYIVNCERVTLPLVPEAELLVFLPDLHLSLFKQDDPKQYRTFSYDTFRHNARYWLGSSPPEYRSLEGELVQLLATADHAKEVIQVGDCFEMWVAQALLIRDHQALVKLYEDEHKWNAYTCGSRPLQTALWRLIAEKKILPRSNMDREIEDMRFAEAPDLERFCVSILSTKAVRAAIIGKYPKLFQNGQFPFRWISGNHDNMLTNDFYSNSGIKGYPIAGDPGGREFVVSCGVGECIWAEHGHQLDEYNSNDNFDKPALVVDFATDKPYSGGFGLTQRNALAKGGWAFVAKYLDKMQKRQLDRFRELSCRVDRLRLIIMGHSHNARLERYTLVDSFGERTPVRFNEGVILQPEEKERRGPWTSIQ